MNFKIRLTIRFEFPWYFVDLIEGLHVKHNTVQQQTIIYYVFYWISDHSLLWQMYSLLPILGHFVHLTWLYDATQQPPSRQWWLQWLPSMSAYLPKYRRMIHVTNDGILRTKISLYDKSFTVPGVYNIIKGKIILHSAPQSKNAVSTFQITCRVLSFVLENS